MCLASVGCSSSIAIDPLDGAVPFHGCGAGTVAVGGMCIATLDSLGDGGGVLCGDGTMRQGAECVATDAGPPVVIACGAGTDLIGGSCVATPVATYDVLASAFAMPGDGHSSFPVYLLGRNADGTPATDDVVVSVVPASAGSLDAYSATLGATPAELWFTPCNVTTSADCEGPFRLVLGKATDPAIELARSAELSIHVPVAVGSPEPCLVGANAMYFDGEAGSTLFSGQKLLLETGGQFDHLATGVDGVTSISVVWQPTEPPWGTSCETSFGSEALLQPLTTSVYRGAEVAGWQTAAAPTFRIMVEGRLCGQAFGAFQLHRLTYDSGALAELLATFEYRCGSPSAPAVRGCVHYTR